MTFMADIQFCISAITKTRKDIYMKSKKKNSGNKNEHKRIAECNNGNYLFWIFILEI